MWVVFGAELRRLAVGEKVGVGLGSFLLSLIHPERPRQLESFSQLLSQGISSRGCLARNEGEVKVEVSLRVPILVEKREVGAYGCRSNRGEEAKHGLAIILRVPMRDLPWVSIEALELTRSSLRGGDGGDGFWRLSHRTEKKVEGKTSCGLPSSACSGSAWDLEEVLPIATS